MTDNRRILSWTLNAADNPSGMNTLAYRDDFDKYAHKIYAMGIHEFDVKGTGVINDRRTGLDAHNQKFPLAIEQDMIDYPHIKWYLSMTCFGTSQLYPLLENTGGAQDTFIQNLNDMVDQYQVSRNSGTPLNLYGIEMDFEASMTDDPERTGDDDRYVSLLQRVKNEVCIPNGLKMQMNLYAMWGENVPYYFRFHNYKKIAEATDMNGNPALDSAQIMTYDFAWGGSAPGASTPVWWFQEVGEWAKQNFDPTLNPAAKLTIDKIFFGSAAYGHRWGIFDESVIKAGSTITFKNLLDWQNGLYKHYMYDGSTYTYGNQEFICQSAFEDPESKNTIMLQHVYDYWNAKFMNLQKLDGADSGKKSAYNGKDYMTTYSRLQYVDFTGIQATITSGTKSGKTSSYTIQKNVGDQLLDFTGYTFANPRYDPAVEYVENPETQEIEANFYCKVETDPETGGDMQYGQVEYTFNVPTAGTYRLISLVSFPWFTSQRLNGTLNGQAFTIGGNLPDHYPLFFKASHWFDVGSFNFVAGENTIIMEGAASQKGVPIFGFVVCQAFTSSLRGATIDATVNAKPFVKKDKTQAAVPTQFVLASEALRADARPTIIFEDRFLQYRNDLGVQANGLEYSTYYTLYKEYKPNGSTYYEDENDSPGYGSCISTPYYDGMSDGHWECPPTGDGSAIGSGALILNRKLNFNVQVEAELIMTESGRAGIRFGAQAANDGYDFIVDTATQQVVLLLNGTTVQTAALPEAVNVGDKFKLRVKMYGGKGYFYFGYSNVQVFGGWVSLSRTTGGGCGIVAGVQTKVYVLSIATLEMWEPLEKIEIEVDGVKYPTGEIPRTVGYNEYGYIAYSGIDEKSTRTAETSGVSLDYEFNLVRIPGFEGAKQITVRLIDAGVWYASLYVGDSAGCSITWSGDSYSFADSMRRAVNDYGAKGIGLWALGQEDPQVFELVPDVVPPYR